MKSLMWNGVPTASTVSHTPTKAMRFLVAHVDLLELRHDAVIRFEPERLGELGLILLAVSPVRFRDRVVERAAGGEVRRIENAAFRKSCRRGGER